MEISLRIDHRKVQAALDIAELKFYNELLDAMDHIKRRFFKDFRSRTRVREGNTRPFLRRMQGYVNATGGRGKVTGISLRLLTYSPVLGLLEIGGTIRAHGRKLRIPQAAALTPTGRLRKRYRRPWSEIDPRLKKNTFIRDDIIFRRIRGRENPVPLFKLEEQVTLPAILNYHATWASLGQWPEARIEQAADKALRKIGNRKSAIANRQ
jgi:hypothetical protein|tara:strand:+ start:1708 stop:2334 length:627 start_codon:yes stop_codon:yes gene_type:complete